VVDNGLPDTARDLDRNTGHDGTLVNPVDQRHAHRTEAIRPRIMSPLWRRRAGERGGQTKRRQGLGWCPGASSGATQIRSYTARPQARCRCRTNQFRRPARPALTRIGARGVYPLAAETPRWVKRATARHCGEKPAQAGHGHQGYLRRTPRGTCSRLRSSQLTTRVQ